MQWTALRLVVSAFAVTATVLVLATALGDRVIAAAAATTFGSLTALFAWVWRHTIRQATSRA